MIYNWIRKVLALWWANTSRDALKLRLWLRKVTAGMFINDLFTTAVDRQYEALWRCLTDEEKRRINNARGDGLIALTAMLANKYNIEGLTE